MDENVGSLRVIDNKALVLHSDPMGIYYNGVEIKTNYDWDKLTGISIYYFDELIYINTQTNDDQSKGIMFVCPWKPGQQNVTDCTTHELNSPTRYYTVFPKQSGDAAIFADAVGNIMEIGAHSLVFIRRSDGTSFNFYGSMAYRDGIVAGHYPTGNVFEIDSEIVAKPMSPPVGRQDCSSPNQREAQSLVLSSGKMTTGVWPFGEIWQRDTDNEWQLLMRAFAGPEPCGEAPYTERVSDGGLVHNALGQRIYGFANWGNGLAFATSLKGQDGELAINLLDEQEAYNYGRVMLIDDKKEVSCELFGSGLMKISIEIRHQRLTVKKDQQEICSRPIQFDPVIFSDWKLVVGNGPWGEFAGEILSAEVEYAK